MAKGMRDIKRQIKSKQNMKQITKAMEMVAASKLRRAQMSAEAARPYAEKIREVIRSIAAAGGDVSHPMLEKREIKRTGYLVITSDRGLCGGYNTNLLRKISHHIRDHHASAEEYTIMVIGRKGRDYFKKRGMPIVEEVTGLSDSPQFLDIKSIASASVSHFEAGDYDELYLVYNEFINAISQTPVIQSLLPLVKSDHDASEEPSEAPSEEYEYEPSPEAVLGVLLPKYAETLIYGALLESKASEFGARMTAMGNATKNATELIDQLTLTFNRARQAAITQEISEIVAGANAQS